jgi:serine/threonine protein phosphatase PrpC
MRLRSAAKTHVGLVRPTNEDAYLCNDAPGLYAVADGMGGHAAGEVASRIAIDFLKLFANHPAHPTEGLPCNFEIIDERILKHAARSTRRPGMGTTLTALAVRDGSATIAHVGDSRCYLVRDGVGRQLTHDHVAPGSQHVLLNCLGGKPGSHVKTDVIHQEVKPGDVFVLCSDGLGDYLDASETARLIAKCAARDTDAYHASPPSYIADILVGIAIARGGADNITVVVVAVEE